MSKINSVSDSGGRSSAYLGWLFKDDSNSEFVFCDTGAEHPETYDFLRKCNAAFNHNIVCLQAKVSKNMGKGNSYNLVGISDVKFDLSLMKENTAKYGGFTNNRPYCTEKLKTIISNKYKNDTHGKGNYYTWIGIRYDEPKRLVGDHVHYEKSAYKQLRATGMFDSEISELFIVISDDIKYLDCDICFFIEDQTKVLLRKRISIQKSHGLKYLAQISKFTKQDVLNWWLEQSFDLTIEEHKGNCVFCVKKSELKVTLAAREEPELFKQWCEMVGDESVRLMPADKFGKGHIYRKWLTPEMLIAQFKDSTTEELRERVYKTKQFDTGSCSESCEVYGDLDQLQFTFNEGKTAMQLLDEAGEEEQMI